jgi:hypothetical protein
LKFTFELKNMVCHIFGRKRSEAKRPAVRVSEAICLKVCDLGAVGVRKEASFCGHSIVRSFFYEIEPLGSARPSAIDQVAALGIVRHLSYSCGKAVRSSSNSRGSLTQRVGFAG